MSLARTSHVLRKATLHFIDAALPCRYTVKEMVSAAKSAAVMFVVHSSALEGIMKRAFVFLLLLQVALPSSALVCDRRPNFENPCAWCDGLSTAWAWGKDGIWCVDCMGKWCPIEEQDKNLNNKTNLNCEAGKIDLPDGFITALLLHDKELEEISRSNPYIGSRLQIFVPVGGNVPPVAFPGFARTSWLISEIASNPMSEEGLIELPTGEYIEVSGQTETDVSADQMRVVFTARHYFPNGDALAVGPRVELTLRRSTNIKEKIGVTDEVGKSATLYEVLQFAVLK
jgi:hypothetical protein